MIYLSINLIGKRFFSNSDDLPFGLTLKGKARSFVLAHETLRNVIIKGKSLKIGNSSIKFVDVDRNSKLINAVAEVSDVDNGKGHAEMKVYIPSHKKGKTVTIEIRKMSGYEFVHAEVLKRFLVKLLDGFIEGKDLNQLIDNGRGDSSKKMSIKSKLFSCDICSFQSRLISGLKTHYTRIHGKKYSLKENDSSVNYGKICVSKTQKLDSDCVRCKDCGLAFVDDKSLADHKGSVHTKSLKRCNSVGSTTISPPKKKQDIEKDYDLGDVEMIEDVVIDEASDIVVKLLEARIKDLESKLDIMKKEKVSAFTFQNRLLKELIELRSSNLTSKTSPRLIDVKSEHLSKLRGFTKRYQIRPDGGCLQSSFAVHAFNDQEKGLDVRRDLNQHIVDNFDYYKEKISWPFVEVVGVGDNSETVTATTDDEMIELLKSEKSLLLYSNSHDVAALANFYNITVNIFCYSKSSDFWHKFEPESKMVRQEESRNQYQDIFLYYE